MHLKIENKAIVTFLLDVWSNEENTSRTSINKLLV